MHDYFKYRFVTYHLVPDIIQSDGIFSEFVTKLSDSGFYSTRFKALLKNSTGVLNWIGPSFYVSVPHLNDGKDHIPPSRFVWQFKILEIGIKKDRYFKTKKQ